MADDLRKNNLLIFMFHSSLLSQEFLDDWCCLILKHSTCACLFSSKELTLEDFFFFLNHPISETKIISILV